MSTEKVIADGFELNREFRRILPDDPDLRWVLTRDVTASPIHPKVLRLDLDDRSIFFRPTFELTPKRTEIQIHHLLAEAGEGERGSQTNPIGLIVAVRLTRRMIEWCKKECLSAMDLNGRTWLRAKGLLVDRGPLPGRDYRLQIVPTNIFTGKSERLVRTLLADVTRTWRQKQLVARTGASSGLVSRVVKHLLQEGHLDEIATKEYRVADWRELLAAWAERDSLRRRVTTYRFNTLGGDPHQWARALRDACAAHSIRIAFTQWLAAWTRNPFTEPVVATAYIDRPLGSALLSELNLREVDEAGKVWLHVPKDEGVFKEVREVNGLPLVTDAQIYLDLQRSGLRGPDQAEALFNWEEFCKP